MEPSGRQPVAVVPGAAGQDGHLPKTPLSKDEWVARSIDPPTRSSAIMVLHRSSV